MASLNELVVTQLRTKNALGFDSPVPIGSDAKYISGIRGTNVNNIEEQFLIGYDCITTKTSLADGTEVVIEEFRNSDTTENYYVLETYNFGTYNTQKQFLKNNVLYLPNDTDDNKYEAQEGAGSLTFLGVDTSVYSFVNDEIHITATARTDTPVASSATLRYKSTGTTALVDVAKKITYAVEESEGKKVQKQIIQNLL